jgi:hypothetical protein
MVSRVSLVLLPWFLACSSPTSPPAKVDTKVATKVDTVTPPVAPPAVNPAKPAVRPAPGPALAKGERRKLEDQGDADKRRAFWAAIQDGRKQTAAKEYAAAVAQFDLALAQLPEHPRALSGRGYVRLLAGELEAAEADLRVALAHPGTANIEAAIEFNLGLVAEKRGQADEAKRRFAIANKLRPSKAAADKLAGATVCPAAVDYTVEGKVYANFTAIWAALVELGVTDAAQRPADEAAARAAVCRSVDLASPERTATDTCAGAANGPWLVTHEGDAWAYHLIERGDGDQWRMTEVGYGEYARCGQRDTVKLIAGEVTRVHRETGYGIVVDVMEDANGEIVDCVDGHECTTACGEDEIEVVDYLFSSRNPDPVVVRTTPEDGVQVDVNGSSVRLTGGGCDLEVALVKP